ncbi:MAG: TOBE domain-containing protein [Rhodobacterales bacterium]
MESGKIRQFAAPEVLYREPVDCFVAGFVGDGAVVSVRPTGQVDRNGLMLKVLGQEVLSRSATAEPSHVSIRPESITLSDDAPLRARVTGCTYLGGRFRLSLDAAGETLVAFARQRATIGETVGIKLQDLWAFRDPDGTVLMEKVLAYA